MVYINSKGEVVDDSRPSPTNIFWKIITFFVLFFKSLIGIDTAPDKKKDNDIGGSGSIKGGFSGGSGGGGSGGGGGPKPPGDPKGGLRKFGPRGFKTISDIRSPPPMGGCAGGACG